MCFSSNALEQQAYRFTEKIHNSTFFKIVRVDFIGKYMDIHSDRPLGAQLNFGEHLPLIKHVILEDYNGRQFTIEPNEFGLKFANGEISYQQYLGAKKTEVRKLLIYTIGSTGVFTFIAGSFIYYCL